MVDGKGRSVPESGSPTYHNAEMGQVSSEDELLFGDICEGKESTLRINSLLLSMHQVFFFQIYVYIYFT